MKRQGYRFGVAWIAENDEPDCLDAKEVSGYISTLLLADLFSKEPEKVATDIIRYRERVNALDYNRSYVYRGIE